MRLLVLVVAIAVGAIPALAGRVILGGSGYLPRPALERFVEWGGGKRGEYLLVVFSSVHGDEIAGKFRAQLDALAIPETAVAVAPRLEQMAEGAIDVDREWPVGEKLKLCPKAKRKFLKQIEAATAIYFAGGDQNKHMAVLADADVKRALHRKLAANVPLAGGSAGLHVLSHPMIAGDGERKPNAHGAVLTADGLGALTNVIADSHFLERKRESRLRRAIRRYPKVALGFGVDEGSALVVDGDIATAMGNSPVEVFVKAQAGGDELRGVRVDPGERFDLRRRARERR